MFLRENIAPEIVQNIVLREKNALFPALTGAERVYKATFRLGSKSSGRAFKCDKIDSPAGHSLGFEESLPPVVEGVDGGAEKATF